MRQATSVQDEAETAVTRLRAAGYCILDRLLPTELIAALRDDLSERFEKTPFCQGDFYGQSTKRFGSLLIRSPHTSSLVQHPLVLDIAQRILGSYCDRFQLNLTQAVEIHPGAPAQPQHRDQDMWGGAKGEIEYLLNVIWPLTPFTARNGATIVWPHSHRCQQDYMLATNDAIAAEMDPGAALFFLGSTLHAGGANNAHLPRSGVIVSYSLGWLKPFESQFLVYPPDVARHFTPELAALVGYAIHRPNLSNYEGQCPSVLLKGTQTEFLPARDALRPEHNAFIAELRRAHSRFDAR